MTERIVSMRTLEMIAGTRVMVGLGLGFLLADRLSDEQRRICGWALFATGALATVPLLAEVLGSDADADTHATRQASHRRSGPVAAKP
jgi:hypothetical protein